MVEDPVADMLTRLRNGAQANKLSVSMPHSNLLENVAAVLKENEYIDDFEVNEHELDVSLAYSDAGKPAISHSKRISKPARRRYVSMKEIPDIRAGRGLVVLSTPEGVLSGDKARQQHVGGELLFEMF